MMLNSDRASDSGQSEAGAGTERERIGVVGVGLVGTALAERLLAGGFEVLGFDCERVCLERLRQLGGRKAASAGEVVADCERIFLCLPTSRIVQTVVDQVAKHFRPGQIVIDTTTSGPAAAIESGQALEQLGVAYLDAAICGSSEELRRGEVLVVAGGPAAAFEKCCDLWVRFARASWRVGEWGAGSRMKLTNNLVLGLNRAALAEALSFAGALGLDLDRVLAILRASSAYSRVMDLKGPKMVARDFTPQARLSQHLKDVRLMVECGEEAGLKLPLTQRHRELLEEAEAAGFGALDNSAIIEVWKKYFHGSNADLSQ